MSNKILGAIIVILLVLMLIGADYFVYLQSKVNETKQEMTTLTLKGYAIIYPNRIEVFTSDTVYIIDLQSKKVVNDKIIKGVK